MLGLEAFYLTFSERRYGEGRCQYQQFSKLEIHEIETLCRIKSFLNVLLLLNKKLATPAVGLPTWHETLPTFRHYPLKLIF
jgi:hypothetical protein